LRAATQIACNDTAPCIVSGRIVKQKKKEEDEEEGGINSLNSSGNQM